MRLVVIGLSITSSWGNGHATTYRSLLRELAALGHDVLFLEQDAPWYAANRDLSAPPFCEVGLYASQLDLDARFRRRVREADAVLVGSYVPDGIRAGEWATETAWGTTAFYDIDTPVTLAALARGECAYLSPELIPCFDLYLSFTGGPTLRRLEHEFGARRARPLYCSADPELYRPEAGEPAWDLGYMGTYSPDRQPGLERLLLTPARQLRKGRFVVAGPQYPASVAWPGNVERIEHLPPAGHRRFYTRQRHTLNVTRADMVAAGWSPSVRLFEASACGTPIISDYWPGLEDFFTPGSEILVAESAEETVRLLSEYDPDERRALGARARERTLAHHTAACRAREFVRWLEESPAPVAGSGR